MLRVGRSAAAAAGRAREAPQGRIDASLRDEIETQRAGHRNRLHQAHRHLVAEPVCLAARLADQRMGRLVVADILVADLSRGDEAVSPGLVELDEEAGTGDAADMALEGRADLLGKEMRDQ